MILNLTLNGKPVSADIPEDMVLLDFSEVRVLQRETWLRDLQLRAVYSMAGRSPGALLQYARRPGPGPAGDHPGGAAKEAKEFGGFLADQGGEQCGFCNPGFIMNVLAMERELKKSHHRRDQRIPGRQPVPLHRLCQPAPGHPGLAETR